MVSGHSWLHASFRVQVIQRIYRLKPIWLIYQLTFTFMNQTLSTRDQFIIGIGMFVTLMMFGFAQITHAQVATTTYTTSTTTGGTIIMTPVVIYTTTGTTINPNPSIPLCEIQRTLRRGSVGQDVRCLQRFLNYSGYTVSASGAGSPGNESTSFGPATANAVMRWQNANSAFVLAPSGMTSGNGIFGPASFNYYVTLVWRAFGLSS